MHSNFITTLALLLAATSTATHYEPKVLSTETAAGSSSQCKFDIPSDPIFPYSTTLISAANPDTVYGSGTPNITANDMCTVWNWKLPASVAKHPRKHNCTLMLAMPEPGEDVYTFSGPGNFTIIDYVFNASISSNYSYSTQPAFRRGATTPIPIVLAPGQVYSLVTETCEQYAPKGTASGRVCSANSTLSFPQTESSTYPGNGCPQGFFVAVT